MPYKLTNMQWKMVARLRSDGEDNGTPVGVGAKTLKECLQLGYVEWWIRGTGRLAQKHLRRTALGDALLKHDYALGRRDPFAP